MVRIFLTGATGFIGGETLYTLKDAFPEAKISALIRSTAGADAVRTSYPNVDIVMGDLDSTETIENEAYAADVIFNLADNKHVGVAESIIKGTLRPGGPKQRLWVQISGASLLGGKEVESGTFGEATSDVYDDIKDARKLRAMIEYFPGRELERLILSQASRTDELKTALIFGPIIFGRGRGPGNRKSVQIPTIRQIAVEKGYSFYVGKGEAIWDNVHVSDVSGLFVKMVEAFQSNSTKDLWNENGLYLPMVGELSWKDIAVSMAKAADANGITAPPKSITPDEANPIIHGVGAMLFGTNARGKVSRARTLLGWTPSGPSLQADISDFEQ